MIRVLKLTSGEEIIGKIVNTDKGAIEMKSPMLLVPTQTEQGQVKVAFMPFAPYGDKEQVIGIYPHAIVADYVPSSDLEQHYSQSFISQIQVVGSMGMVGLK
jgi:hypothetical protein